eukprot:SAG31_NODE_41273_length_277_cov_0.573034_1_plen_62_part_01
MHPSSTHSCARACLQRIYNRTHNAIYAEVTSLEDWFFEKPYFYEYYDIGRDPYQVKTTYSSL